jgi:transcriptional regulator with XRE-family HTH domain
LVAKTDRPIVVPDFGAFLRLARETRHLSLNEVVARMHAATPEQHGFTRPQLERYERGQTPRPDPVTLFHLADICGVDIRDLIAALARARDQLHAERARRAERKPKAPPGRRPDSGRRAS